jgi:hypothetical protein
VLWKYLSMNSHCVRQLNVHLIYFHRPSITINCFSTSPHPSQRDSMFVENQSENMMNIVSIEGCSEPLRRYNLFRERGMVSDYQEHLMNPGSIGNLRQGNRRLTAIITCSMYHERRLYPHQLTYLLNKDLISFKNFITMLI